MPLYKDLDLTMATHPTTGDVAKRNDIRSLTQSIKTICLSSQGEIINKPQIGANIRDLLHAPQSRLTQLNIVTAITDAINNFESRVELDEVIADFIENGYNIRISFFMDTSVERVDIQFPLVKN